MDQGKDSTFAALRMAPPEPSSPPPAPPAPKPADSVVPAPAARDEIKEMAHKVAELERRLAEPPQDRTSDARIDSLERQLKETQEKAIGAMVSLKEREEAQKSAQLESEALMKTIAAQRRAEELDHRTREQVAAQKTRIESLEERLLQAANRPQAADLAPELRVLYAQCAALRASADAMGSALEEQRRARESAAEAHDRLREDLARLSGRAAQAAADARAAADADFAALRAEIAELREAASLRAEREASSPLPEDVASLVERRLEQFHASVFRQAEAAKGAAAEALRFARARPHEAADAELADALARERAERIEQADRLARDSALRAAEQAEMMRKGLGSAVERLQSAAQALDAQGLAARERAEKSDAEGTEKLLALEAELRTLAPLVAALARERAEGGDVVGLAARFDALKMRSLTWDRTVSAVEQLAELVGLLRGEAQQSGRVAVEAVSRLETEMRGLILVRLLRLEKSAAKGVKE
jgi:hypothetical protein